MTAYEYALRLLARREHSAKELQHKSIQKGFSEELITETLQSLQEQNLQSDSRFSEMYVHMRLRKGYGPVRIAAELSERGISKALIEEYIGHTSSKETWCQQIIQVWQKKFRGIKPKDFQEQAKQMRFLQYRGFNHEQIKWLFAEKL